MFFSCNSNPDLKKVKEITEEMNTIIEEFNKEGLDKEEAEVLITRFDALTDQIPASYNKVDEKELVKMEGGTELYTAAMKFTAIVKKFQEKCAKEEEEKYEKDMENLEKELSLDSELNFEPSNEE